MVPFGVKLSNDEAGSALRRVHPVIDKSLPRIQSGSRRNNAYPPQLPNLVQSGHFCVKTKQDGDSHNDKL